MSTHANMVKMTVTSVAEAGEGTITLNAASSGYQTFGAGFGNADATVDILITEGTTWEVARNCFYDHSELTVTRGTWEDSSNGTGAVAFTSAAVVSVVATAEIGNKLEQALKAVTPGGRLTTESGVPVSTSDRTAQADLWYTPFVHNVINLWDGAEWKPVTFVETKVTGASLTGLTSGKPYDVFAYLSSGALALEVLVWTNDTTRATAVTLQDGRYCKDGAKDSLLVGTFYTTSATTTEDSQTNRFVANVYNAIPMRMFSCPAYSDGNTVTSYSLTSTTWVEANGGTGSRVNYVLPLPAMVAVGAQAVGDPQSTYSIGAGVGNDSATTASIEQLGVTSVRISASTMGRFQQGPGKHYGALLLRTSGGTSTIYSDDGRSGGASDPALTHIHGEVSA